MVAYAPETPYQRLLDRLRALPDPVGRIARRKLDRRYRRRAVADFDRRIAGVGPGDVLIDLGANAGDMTAKMAATGAVVHAWEPDPWSFDRLQRRFAGATNVHLHNAAVAARPGRLRLTRPADFAADPDTHSTASSIYFDNGAAPADGVEVEVISFAQALDTAGGRAAIIKMDIEGAEFDILADVLRNPANWPFDALYVETHERLERGKIPVVDGFRRQAAACAHPDINLFWP